MTFIVDRIAAYLCTHGPTASVDIAKALELTTAQVSDAVRRVTTQARYGLHVVGTADPAEHPCAPLPRVWAIDAGVYKDYLASKGMKSKPRAVQVERVAKPKPKATSVKVPKVIYTPIAERPVYAGPMLTRWLPSSPYYQEQT